MKVMEANEFKEEQSEILTYIYITKDCGGNLKIHKDE